MKIERVSWRFPSGTSWDNKWQASHKYRAGSYSVEGEQGPFIIMAWGVGDDGPVYRMLQDTLINEVWVTKCENALSPYVAPPDVVSPAKALTTFEGDAKVDCAEWSVKDGRIEKK